MAVAGAGHLVPDCAPGTAVECPDGDSAGDVTLELNLQAPLDQATIQQSQIKEQFRRANKIFCDATDGQIRIRHVKVTAGASKAENADFFWYPQVGRSNTAGVLQGPGHIYMYGYNTAQTQLRGDVIAHELGHYILGLGESYAERPRYAASGCELGPAFDGPQAPGLDFLLDQEVPDNSPFGIAGLQTEREHSIMQTSAQTCRRSRVNPPFHDTLAPSQVDTQDWFGLDQPCLTDSSCSNIGFLNCDERPLLSTELSVHNSFDLLAATNDTGFGFGSGACPVLPAREIVITGKLNPGFSPSCGRDANGDGDTVDTSLGEDCELFAIRNTCTLLGTLECGTRNCIFDSTHCLPQFPALCGNGHVDSLEDCDDPNLAVPCSSISGFSGQPLAGGTARCDMTNCQYDRSECVSASIPKPNRPPATFDEINAPGVSTVPFGFFDAEGDLGQLGEVNGGTSRHTMFVTLQRFAPNDWGLFFGMDAKEFLVGNAGDYVRIAAYNLKFGQPSGKLISINGIPYDVNHPTDNAPEIVIGSDTQAVAYGVLEYIGTGGGQEIPTQRFRNLHQPMSLTLRLENLLETLFKAPGGQIAGNLVTAFPRHGEVESGQFQGRAIPPTGKCMDNLWCRFAWNSETQRYEGSHQRIAELEGAYAKSPDAVLANPADFVLSDWEQAKATLESRFGFTLRLPAGDGLPDADTPDSVCPDPDVTFDGNFDSPDEVVLVLDKSGSMSEDEGRAVGAKQSRLDFVKAAARVFVARESRGSKLAKTGLIWFDSQATVQAGGTPLRDLTPGTVAPAGTNDADLEAFLQTSSTVGSDDLLRYLRDSTDKAGERPVPGGLTSIGGGLSLAGTLFSTKPGALQAVVLLTDGEETAFPKTSDKNPDVEAKSLTDRGVEIFTVAAGKDADQKALATYSDASGGKAFDANDGTELPPTFFEAFVRQQGQSLTRDHHSAFTLEREGTGEFPHQFRVYTIQVEPGARALTILGSTQLGAGSAPELALRDPDGLAFNPQQLDDPYFTLLTVPTPKPGAWTARIEYFGDSTPIEWVSAHVDNPLANCSAGFQSRIVHAGEDPVLVAHPIYGTTIGAGASLSALIRRPDDSVLVRSLGYDVLHQDYRVTLAASDLIGKGRYQAIVTCNVPSGATFEAGETIFPGQDLSQGVVTPFVRETTTYFYLDVAALPPVPGPGSVFAGDCDGDGIPNASEPQGDLDGDGAPDVCDADADGDDVPDGIDPDIRLKNAPCGLSSANLSRSTCLPGPQTVTFPVAAGCSGSLVELNGTPIVPPVPLNGGSVTLRPGVFALRWSSSDGQGGSVTLDQTVTLTLSDSRACCSAGQQILDGTELADNFTPANQVDYCVLGHAGADYVLTQGGNDTLIGGADADYLNSGAGSDVIVGGDGQDFIYGAASGRMIAYGGPDADSILALLSSSSQLYGGGGGDMLVGGDGADLLVPGAGANAAIAGAGDDTVVLYDACEVSAGLFLDGGSGSDTLITPLPLPDLQARGVTVVGFESIIVNPNQRYLAECTQ